MGSPWRRTRPDYAGQFPAVSERRQRVDGVGLNCPACDSTMGGQLPAHRASSVPLPGIGRLPDSATSLVRKIVRRAFCSDSKRSSRCRISSGDRERIFLNDVLDGHARIIQGRRGKVTSLNPPSFRRVHLRQVISHATPIFHATGTKRPQCLVNRLGLRPKWFAISFPVFGPLSRMKS